MKIKDYEWVRFKYDFEEPKERYHLLSTALFYKGDYTKIRRDNSMENISEKRQEAFIKMYNYYLDEMENNRFPENTYLRIYMDKSIDLYKRWSKILERKHEKMQIVYYELSKDYVDPTNPDIYLGFIGTIMRFYPVFDPKCRAEIISTIDMDAIYTKKWFEEIEKFKESKSNVQVLSSMFNIPFYGIIIQGITKMKARGYWCSAGLISFKGNIFEEKQWINLPWLFARPDFIGQMRFVDAFKLAIFDNNNENLMEDFEYGYDEYLLNFLIDEKEKQDKIRMKIVHLKGKGIDFFTKRLVLYLKWCQIKSKRFVFLLKELGFKSWEELEKTILDFKTADDMVKFFRNEKVLKLLEKFPIDQRIVYIFRNYRFGDFKKYQYSTVFIQDALMYQHKESISE
jgi:hypothetical protein